MFKLFKISGNSLFPLFKDGNRVLARKILKKTKINIGDFVVFNHNKHGLMIKQVKYVKNKQFFVQGTDAYSVDSRDFGLIDLSALLYKVMF